VNPEELIKQLATLDEAGQHQLILEAVNSGEMDTEGLAEVMRWAIRNNPGLSMWVQELHTQTVLAEPSPIESPFEEQKRIDAEQAKIEQDQTVRAQATDPTSAGGEGITEEERAAAEEAGTDIPANAEPQWILEQYGPLTDEQKRRILDDVAFMYGERFEMFEQLAASGLLDDATAEVRQLVDGAILDTPPQSSWTIDLPGGDLFTMKVEDWNTVQAKYGIDEKQLTSFVKLANALGVKDPLGRVNWQPILALASATGLLDSLNLGTTLIRDTGGGLGKSHVPPPPGPERVRFQEVDTANPAADFFTRDLGNVNMGILKGEGLQIDTRFSFRELVKEYQKGLERYQDEAMAVIYAYDPALAGRIEISAGDPTQLRGQDLRKVSAIFNAELNEEWFAQSPLSILSPYLQMADAKRQARDEAEGDGRQPKAELVRQKPDPATVNEQLRALYQAMFFEEPDEATLATFRAQINSAIEGMGEGESVDVSARAREFAREDPRYGQLYGNKPANVDEESYRNQFRAGTISMLGAEVGDNASTLAGMRSGKYQTTVGSAAGMSEAWDNSTFMGRLARAAQIIGENT